MPTTAVSAKSSTGPTLPDEALAIRRLTVAFDELALVT